MTPYRASDVGHLFDLAAVLNHSCASEYSEKLSQTAVNLMSLKAHFSDKHRIRHKVGLARTPGTDSWLM